MIDPVFTTILVVLIAFVTVVLGLVSLRKDRDPDGERRRGLEPGTGEHIVEVTYTSGLSGGDTARIRVPRDPQEYAKQFVPRDTSRATHSKDKSHDR